MAIMGRPKKEIDWEEFDKLCHIQCTKKEIAAWFDCSEDTIENKIREKFDTTFSVVYDQKRCGGKISLRRTQFQMAEKSAAMAIWLGKQYLDQTEKVEQIIEQTSDIVEYKTKWAGVDESKEPDSV